MSNKHEWCAMFSTNPKRQSVNDNVMFFQVKDFCKYKRLGFDCKKIPVIVDPVTKTGLYNSYNLTKNEYFWQKNNDTCVEVK